MNKPTYEELEAAMIEKTSEWAALAGRRLAELTRLRAQVALDERTKAAMLREGLQERDALRARVAEQEEKAERYRLDALKFEARNARLVAALDRIANCEQGDITDRQAVMMMREIARLTISDMEDSA